MKQFKLAASVFVCTSLLSSSAFANYFMKDGAVSGAPYNWTGFYAGLNAGAVKNTMNITDNQASSFNATIQQSSDPAFTGGIQVGYRRQLDFTKTSGVYGLELSANSSNVRFNQNYGSPFALYQLRTENQIDSYALLQLIGGIAADRTLLFLAAGLSWTSISGSVRNLSSIPFFNSFNINQNIFGTAIGAGIEYAATDSISVRFKVDVITPSTYTVSNNVGDNYFIANNVVQGTVGVNYNFG
jgi:opacity protein-like surface antigen